jgi:hypothetical protein
VHGCMSECVCKCPGVCLKSVSRDCN